MSLGLLAGLAGGLASGIGGIFAGNETKKAAKRNDALLTGFETKGTGYIDAAHAGAKGYLDQAGGIYKGIADLGKSNMGFYRDALGLGGAEGNAATMERFQAGPGYQFAMDQGLNALERRAGAQGRLQSGNTGLDTLTYATGLADQTYGNWMDRLQGYDAQNTGLYTMGTTGQAGTMGSLADLELGIGDRRLNLGSEVLNGRMGASNQKATGAQQQIGGIAGGIAGLGGFLSGYR